MNKGFLILLIFIFGGLTLPAQEKFVPGELIVQFRGQVEVGEWVHDINRKHGNDFLLTAERELSRKMKAWLFSFETFGKTNEKHVIIVLNRYPAIEHCQLNRLLELREQPDDPLFEKQWNLHNTPNNLGYEDADIDALEAWNITTGGLTAEGDTIVVAVMDDGLDLQHEDLRNNIWKNHAEIPGNGIDEDSNGYVDDYHGWDYLTYSDTIPRQSHGTGVASIIGAEGNNGIGLSGINWNVKLLTVSMNFHTLNEANVIAAYDYVLQFRIKYNETEGKEGAFVVAANTSWGLNKSWPADAPLWCAMYDTLGKHGILTAAATTNNNLDVDVVGDLPSTCPSDYLLTVTSTRSDDQKENGTGYGPVSIDIGAPGKSVYAASIYNKYEPNFTGTSIATPHIAGAIALIYATTCNELIKDAKSSPDSVALMVRQMILNSVDTLSSLKGITTTGGRLNIYKAILEAENYGSCELQSIENGLDADADQKGIMRLYPNPADKIITIEYDNQKTGNNRFVICNMLGKKVFKYEDEIKSPGYHSTSLDIGHLAPGIYFLYIASGYKQSQLHKFVVY